MYLRAILVKPSPSLVGVLHRPAGPGRSTTPRFCSSSCNMDNKQQAPSMSSGDAMSDSFGEGYATRADEEGYGAGIYSDTQQLINKDRKEMNDNSPEHDKSQGSEVKEKEKEKGRNLDKDGA